MSAPAAKSFELRGWHVLIAVVVFFGTVIAVDVAFAVQAYRSFPGEVTDKPYEEGLAFNRTLAERAAERSLGWKANVAISQKDVGRTQVRLTISDPAGAPVKSLRLTGRLERPATEQGRLELSFTETKAGIYDALAPDTPGAWDLSVSGVDRTGHAFEAERRLVWR